MIPSYATGRIEGRPVPVAVMGGEALGLPTSDCAVAAEGGLRDRLV